MNATRDALVKFDRRGRLRYAPEQKAAILAAFASSGLSGPKFAALHGVKYQTFAAQHQRGQSLNFEFLLAVAGSGP
jgi:hypothetical protein